MKTKEGKEKADELIKVANELKEIQNDTMESDRNNNTEKIYSKGANINYN